MRKEPLSDNAVEVPFECKGVHLFVDRRSFSDLIHFDVRKYYETDKLPKQQYDGAFTPSEKGIALRPETWRKVIEILTEMIEKEC